jgi:hypothetical protein
MKMKWYEYRTVQVILSVLFWGLIIWAMSLLGFGDKQDKDRMNQDDYYDSRIH